MFNVLVAHMRMTFLHTFRGICNILIYNDKLLAFKTGGSVVRSLLHIREVPVKSCACAQWSKAAMSGGNTNG